MGGQLEERVARRGMAVDRRVLLAGLAACLLSACSGAARRLAAAPSVNAQSPRAVPETVPGTTTTSSTTPAATTTTTTTVPAPSSSTSATTRPEPATTLPLPADLPVRPIAPRAKPVYKLKDYLPAAPASAVALTIDDGPDPIWTPAVLAVLARNGVKATFSVVGIHASRYPGLVQRIVASGHALCNHTMTHPQPFVARSAAQIDEEIVRGTVAIYRATGRVPSVFRSPGGEWNAAAFASCARVGQTPIDWDLDPQDWKRPGTTVVTQRLLAARPGDILLCHDGGGDRSETVNALQTVLPALKSRGLTFVVL